MAGNIEGYAAREINNARKAIDLLKILDYPYKQDCKILIKVGLLTNYTVKEGDVDIWVVDVDIWVVDVDGIKGLVLAAF